jgi:hypothetical protein
MSAVDTLKEHSRSYSELVRRNIQFVTPADVPDGRLYHISTNTDIKSFVPLIGRRQMLKEDRTVPRICTAATLLGCFIGYTKALSSDFRIPSTGKEENEFYKGGWKIYGFPFEAGIRPKEALLPDGDESDEHWLVSYDQATAEYEPVVIGKMFIREIRMVATSGKRPKTDIQLYLENMSDAPVSFSKRLVLEPGYHCVTGPGFNEVSHWADDAEYQDSIISKTEYTEAKLHCANLLGLEDQMPGFFKW